MLKIQKEVLEELPKEKITKIVFEGAKIVVYTKDHELFKRGFEVGKELASKFKKRFEIRVDPKFLTKEEDAKRVINNILGKYTKIRNIYIEKHLSRIVVEVYSPENITHEIINILREKTLYSIKIKRAPLKSSKIIDVVRAYLHMKSKYRAKFLHEVGKKILKKEFERSKDNIIRISILGAGREVGRSAFLLHTGESNIILDMGVGVSLTTKDDFPLLNLPEIDIDRIDAIIISHAHLDHIGFLPFLFRAGIKAPVYLTEPTRDIGALTLFDYIKVAAKQAKQAPYSAKDIKEFLKHTITLKYGEVYDITPDVKVTLHDAGHMIGSSMIHLNIDKKHNVLYTGDLKVNGSKLLNRPNFKFPRLETLIIESTYGGNKDYHPPREETEKEFIHDIKETLDNKGKVLIPVLAVGRAQEILLIVTEAILSGMISEVPIYLDGILWETSMIHTAYPEYLSKDLQNMILSGKNPFEQDFIYRAGRKDRKDIMESREPAIIIATSGMMQGGPIVEYFKYGADSEKNLLAFVSYQARGTLGRRILDGENLLIIDGEKIEVKLKYKKYDGFSGHADRKELVQFMAKLTPRPKQAIIVHGEVPKPFELAAKYKKTFNVYSYAPKVGDAIRLD